MYSSYIHRTNTQEPVHSRKNLISVFLKRIDLFLIHIWNRHPGSNTPAKKYYIWIPYTHIYIPHTHTQNWYTETNTSPKEHHICMPLHARRRSDFKYLDLQISQFSWEIFWVTGTPFTLVKTCIKIWELPWKRALYVRGLPWKLVEIFGSRSFFKANLLCLWYMYICIARTYPELTHRNQYTHERFSYFYSWYVYLYSLYPRKNDTYKCT